MDTNTLLAQLDFTRQRLLAILETIEKSGQPVEKVLAWRPGPGRAHIAWQAMHCAATHDRYLEVRLKGGEGTPKNPRVAEEFGGGSTPSDSNVPSLAAIRQELAARYESFRAFVAGLTPADLARKVVMGGGVERTIGESILLLTWHEAHHQGQIHLTWNCYKAAHGVG